MGGRELVVKFTSKSGPTLAPVSLAGVRWGGQHQVGEPAEHGAAGAEEVNVLTDGVGETGGAHVIVGKPVDAVLEDDTKEAVVRGVGNQRVSADAKVNWGGYSRVLSIQSASPALHLPS